MMSKQLKGHEIKKLRGAARRLKPNIHIGKRGMNKPVEKEIDAALTKHELIKIRFNADRDTIGELSNYITDTLQCTLIARIGKVVVLFRATPKEISNKGA